MDEGARADTTPEGLAKLRTVFAARGSVTAGNSSQTSTARAPDPGQRGRGEALWPQAAGALCVLCQPGRAAPHHGHRPHRGHSGGAENAGLKQDDIDWIELNEAFAAQSLAVINTLGLDPAKVNPMGGAIALGHPLGATGAIRAATVVHALQRKNLKYGMVTMCVGHGAGRSRDF
jgi:acetyl-CoA acyltransferase